MWFYPLKGSISCVGDSWRLEKIGRRGMVYAGNIGSPSKQAKSNALALRRFLMDRLGVKTYVNSLVCITNPKSELHVRNPTVNVVRVEELRSLLLSFESKRTLPVNEVKRIKTELEKYSSSYC